MTTETHRLENRTEAEVLWWQRRNFLQAAAGWAAIGGFSGAAAQSRGNIVQLTGDALRNGQRLIAGESVTTGDTLETGPGSMLQFVIGSSAFHVRQNSRMTVERGNSINAVSVLRLLTGAVVSVWGRGSTRQIVTPTLTAGIRGTGVYTGIHPDGRTYFCTCYGTVDMESFSSERRLSRAEYHQSFWARPTPRPGSNDYLVPTAMIDHTDEEVEFLARLVAQRTAWQVAGRKGRLDGSGRVETY